ncbi:MAG: ABC transporter permease [Candidatus Binatia bacterium]
MNYLLVQVTSFQFLISVLLLITLIYLVLGPLFELIWRTVTWGERDTRLAREAVPGALTLFHWKYMLFGPSVGAILLEPLTNTLITGMTAAILALALGSLLAWLIVRTDMSGRRWLQPVLTLPYVVPSFALALVWETLFRSSALGGVAGFFETISGIAPPSWMAYGPVPIIVTMTIHFYPFAFLLVSGALATVDAQLVESAELLGASRWTILCKITFPLVTPALWAAFILIFGKTIGTFALPFLLGAPVQFYTLSTLLFSSLKLGMDARGYILALVLILLTAGVVYFNYRILGRTTRRFETIGGKGFKGNPTALGQWRWLAFAFVCAIALITALLPTGLMVYRTLMLLDGRYGLENLTLHYWIGGSNPEIAHGQPGVLQNPVIVGAAWNSIRLAALSSAICGILGLVIGYIVTRNRGTWTSKLLDQISFVPFLFPAIALGAMYLSLFAVQRGPIPPLYGTFALLVLIAVVDKLPYTTRTGSSAVTQIGQELEEAAEIQGASWLGRFWHIVLPLATSGLMAGMMVSFVSIMRELSLIIFIITPSTGVLMTVGFRFAEEGQPQLANALVLLVTLITITGELMIWWLGKGRLARLQEK